MDSHVMSHWLYFQYITHDVIHLEYTKKSDGAISLEVCSS